MNLKDELRRHQEAQERWAEEARRNRERFEPWLQDMPRRRAEMDEKAAERQRDRELALRLIDSGVRELRKRLRPIRGKPAAWQNRLRKVAARLRRSV
jgi:hypothetical protein